MKKMILYSFRCFSSNPFSGKTFVELDLLFIEKGFTKIGPDPRNGKGAYFHPDTGRKYYFDKGGIYRKGAEPPHVDVHRMMHGVNLQSQGKRRFPL